jgi:TPR repeat protein
MRAAVILACAASVACFEPAVVSSRTAADESSAPAGSTGSESTPASAPEEAGSHSDWVGIAPPPPTPVAPPLVLVSAPGDVAKDACESGTLAQCAALCAHDGEGCALLGRRICREGSVDECTAACDGGNAAACYGLAGITAAGTRVPQNAGRTRVLLEKACSGGHAVACWHLGLGRQYHSFPGAEGRRPSVDAFERACDLTEASSQQDEGGLAWSALYDAEFKSELAQRVDAVMSDERDDWIPGPSCNMVVHLSPKRAARLFEKHCATPASTAAAHVPPACDGLVDLAPDRALPLVGPRCSGGDEEACRLVVRVADAKPKLVDDPLKIAALRKLCDSAAAKKETAAVDSCGRLKDLGASP